MIAESLLDTFCRSATSDKIHFQDLVSTVSTDKTRGFVYHAFVIGEAPHSKGLQPMQPSFTPAAQILWDAIPSHFQEQVLHNVWCPHCGDMITMTDFTGEVHGKSLVLRGTCVTCQGKVARVLEGPPEHVILQPGDRVIWWKRIPGGDYVSPVQATVLALTDKRVKIEADDDGETVLRYVPPQSLQRQG